MRQLFADPLQVAHGDWQACHFPVIASAYFPDGQAVSATQVCGDAESFKKYPLKHLSQVVTLEHFPQFDRQLFDHLLVASVYFPSSQLCVHDT